MRMKKCRYRDRQGKRGEGCLLEFQLNSTQGGSNRIYCENCQKLAAKDRAAKHHASEDPERQRNRNRDNRRKAAEAAGRIYRPMTGMQPCRYLDCEGNPGPDCLVEFKPESGIQLYCENCWRLARNDRQSKAKLKSYYADKAAGGARYEKHLERGRRSSAAYHARLRDLVDVAKLRPSDWWKHTLEQRIIADVLLSRKGYMSNQELGELLDASRIVKSHYRIGKVEVDWETALARCQPAKNYIGDVRTWVGRPGRATRKKKP
jgi:hypothetical protein